jgi:hypothetical protein
MNPNFWCIIGLGTYRNTGVKINEYLGHTFVDTSMSPIDGINSGINGFKMISKSYLQACIPQYTQIFTSSSFTGELNSTSPPPSSAARETWDVFLTDSGRRIAFWAQKCWIVSSSVPQLQTSVFFYANGCWLGEVRLGTSSSSSSSAERHLYLTF